MVARSRLQRFLLSTTGLVLVTVSSLTAPSRALAGCDIAVFEEVAFTVTCGTTATQDTINTGDVSPGTVNNDRTYKIGAPLAGIINSGATISQYGLEFQATSNGDIVGPQLIHPLI